MTWLTVFTALIGGAACAIISVPLTVWLVLINLEDEFEALHAIARSARQTPSPPLAVTPASSPAPVMPSGSSAWPPYAPQTAPGYVRGSDGIVRPKDGYPGAHGLRGYDSLGWD